MAAETGNTDPVERDNFTSSRNLGTQSSDIGRNYTSRLHNAVIEGQLSVMLAILSQNVEVDQRTQEMRTPLHISCMMG